MPCHFQTDHYSPGVTWNESFIVKGESNCQYHLVQKPCNDHLDILLAQNGLADIHVYVGVCECDCIFLVHILMEVGGGGAGPPIKLGDGGWVGSGLPLPPPMCRPRQNIPLSYYMCYAALRRPIRVLELE